MRWSIRIGRFAGVDVYVHVTFLALLFWIVAARFLQNYRWQDALSEGFFILVIFGIIVLHEMGHALAARRYGVQTRDITLLPIGGVARMARIPDVPYQELVVALAGPAVNVIIAAGLYLGASAADRLNIGHSSFLEGTFLTRLFWVNVILVVFNLLPAFPMDGGRALRALLAMRMDYMRATHIAAGIGQAMAFLFGLIGLFYNPFLVFVALFVWIGAAQEASITQMRAALNGIPVERAMIREFQTLAPTDSLADVTRHILDGFQHDFPVVQDHHVIGLLTRDDVMTGLARSGPEQRVNDVMRRDFDTASPSEMLEGALIRLEQSNCPTLPVMRNGTIVGLLTPDNIGEFVMIQAALGKPRSSA